MALVLTTAADPGDSYWAPAPPVDLQYWTEDGSGDLFPDMTGTQNLGLETSYVNRFYGHTFFGSNQAIATDIMPGADTIPRLTLFNYDPSTASLGVTGNGSTGIVAGIVTTDDAGFIGGIQTMGNAGSIAAGNVDAEGKNMGLIRAGTGSLALGKMYIRSALIGTYLPNYIRSNFGSMSSGNILSNEGTTAITATSGSIANAHVNSLYYPGGYYHTVGLLADLGSENFAHIANTGVISPYTTLNQAQQGSISFSYLYNCPSANISAYRGSWVSVSNAGIYDIAVTANRGSLVAGITSTNSTVSTYDGCMVLGNFVGTITAYRGSLILGLLDQVYANSSLAMGQGDLGPQAEGSFALGFGGDYSVIAAGQGSFAGGSTGSIAAVYAQYFASFAWGRSSNSGYPIHAAAPATVQWFSGNNAYTNSMQVGGVSGRKIRIFGNNAYAYTNGDMWCDGTDVFVYSGGVLKNMSNIP